MIRSRERRAQLLEALRAGEADVEDLAARFGVSASTVRRDLQRLSRDNAVRRTYGGAILANHQPETTLGERFAINNAAKRAIAKAAAALVEDGDTLILDAGSTVVAFAERLRGRKLTIVTNNLAVLPLLADEPGVTLIALGGALRPTSMGTVGPLAIEAMRRMTADRVFMSADGVVAGRGLCEASLEQVALKSLMMAQARETVVLADVTKIGRANCSAWAPLPARWTLVTDTVEKREEFLELERYGARVVFAGG
ncbi:DeoR/GlpR family DNA-binding transcription regulator [Methylopila turkensis]|uniref:DeoR family transcriptional regulator n=1 Tax=Methylopila turkensis TaxID=1437816 RepID=A0A9W6N646_9HYPH|nr:DeoR/GlpR family DNA-binding transcription regulator [Methylopila turkensis]GLK78942.1 DeoR family transcriptional regulator [Methylopila turkensis]